MSHNPTDRDELLRRQGPSVARRTKLKLDEYNARSVSLSRRSELASAALVIMAVIELMNRIVHHGRLAESTGEADTSTMDSAIALIEELERGELYLSGKESHLLPRPDSADTVASIEGQGGATPRELIDQALPVLRQIRDRIDRFLSITNQDNVRDFLPQDIERVIAARSCLRLIHAGLMDQLRAFGRSPDRGLGAV